MVGFSEDTAIKVWKGTDDGLTADTLCAELSIERHTVERLRIVKNGFETGKTDKQLVTREWDLETIKLLRKWWVHYQISKNPEARKRHIQRLIKLSEAFRSRIVNPEIEKRDFPTHQSTWYRLGQDWRFTSVAWLDIMTPHLVDEKLIERDFPGHNSLRQHIPDIPFWSHYKKLHNECMSLDDDIDKAIEKLRIEDFPTYKKFIEYKSILEDVPFERGSSPKYMISQIEITRLNSDEMDFLAKVFQIFTKYVPDYGKRLVELENMLQQLWDDLDPDDIEPRIENGTCPKCFPNISQDVKE